MTIRTSRTVALTTIAALLLPACATRPENVVASHVSTSRYAERTCKSLARELDEVQDALRMQGAKLNDKATQDAVVTGIGVVLFWPVLFALGNNAGLEGDVARLKGEEQAIRKQMRETDCEAPAPKPAPASPSSSMPESTNPGVVPASATQRAANDPSPSASMLPTPARRSDGMQ